MVNNFRDVSNLQMLFEQIRDAKVKISPFHAMACTGTVIYAAEDFVVIENKGKQKIIPYNAILIVEIEK